MAIAAPLTKAAALSNYFEDRIGKVRRGEARKSASNRELIGLIYLADWKHALTEGDQLTELQWRVEPRGLIPVITDQADIHISCDPEEQDCIEKELEERIFASLRQIEVDFKSVLDADDFEIADSIINFLEDFPSLSLFVGSTYPMAIKAIHKDLDLSELAQQYKKLSEIMLTDCQL